MNDDAQKSKHTMVLGNFFRVRDKSHHPRDSHRNNALKRVAGLRSHEHHVIHKDEGKCRLVIQNNPENSIKKWRST
jgi:hypothetical protein